MYPWFAAMINMATQYHPLQVRMYCHDHITLMPCGVDPSEVVQDAPIDGFQIR